MLFWERHGLSAEEFSNLIEKTPNLKGCADGIIGEDYIRRDLSAIKHVSNVCKIPDSNPKKGDWLFTYRGEEFSIESKNITKKDLKITDSGFTGIAMPRERSTRLVVLPSGVEFKTDCLTTGKFDILGIDMFNGLYEHKCLYILNRDLPLVRAARYSDEAKRLLINPRYKVEWPLPTGSKATTNLEKLLKILYKERQNIV
jgi:hypothetical protein